MSEREKRERNSESVAVWQCGTRHQVRGGVGVVHVLSLFLFLGPSSYYLHGLDWIGNRISTTTTTAFSIHYYHRRSVTGRWIGALIFGAGEGKDN